MKKIICKVGNCELILMIDKKHGIYFYTETPKCKSGMYPRNPIKQLLEMINFKSNELIQAQNELDNLIAQNRINNMENKEDDLFYANTPCRSFSTDPFHCAGGEVEGVCLKMDRWMQLKNYVDKLKKENERLKRKIGHTQVMIDHHVRMIEELQDCLQTKDRAIAKSIEVITEMEPLFLNRHYINPKCRTKKGWREYLYNETD